MTDLPTIPPYLHPEQKTPAWKEDQRRDRALQHLTGVLNTGLIHSSRAAQPDCFIISDAGVRNNGKKGGASVSIAILADRTIITRKQHKGKVDSTDLEYQAALQGLKDAHENNPSLQRPCFFLDNKAAISHLQTTQHTAPSYAEYIVLRQARIFRPKEGGPFDNETLSAVMLIHNWLDVLAKRYNDHTLGNFTETFSIPAITPPSVSNRPTPQEIHHR